MSFRPIIERWPRPRKVTLAADLGKKRNAVQQWWCRDWIPAEEYPAIEAAAKARGFEDITVERLFDIMQRLREARARAARGASEAMTDAAA